MEKDSLTIILVIILIVIIGGIIGFGYKIFKGNDNVQTIASEIGDLKSQELESISDTSIKSQSNTKIKKNTKNTTFMDELNYMNIAIIIVGGFLLIVYLVNAISFWKIFKENGESGIASIIPIYNTMVLYKIVGLKMWYVLLIFIPIIGSLIAAIINIYALYLLAHKYNKGIGFTLGLIFLQVIFLPILAFGPREKDRNENFFNQY